MRRVRPKHGHSSAGGKVSPGIRLWSWCCFLPGLLLLVVPAAGLGLWDELAHLYRQSHFDAARELLASQDELGGRPGEESLWQLLLTQDPAVALSAAKTLQDSKDVPDQLRQQAVLEEASIHFARGNYRQALAPLQEMADRQDGLPGEHYLLMGLCYWALRDIQKSREIFATIPQSDPNFIWARYYLGYLGLETGDPTLALRYFESATRSPLAPRTPSLLTGQWEVLRNEARLDEAEDMRRTVLQDHPYSLAALRLRHLLDREAADQLADPPMTEIDSTKSDVQPSRGRFSLQLAAFADRSRALTFLASLQAELPALRIDEVADPDHPILYKVRLGHFVSRNQARTESERLRRNHGLDALIVESGP